MPAADMTKPAVRGGPRRPARPVAGGRAIRAAGAALGLPLAATVLAACGTSGTGAPAASAAAPVTTAPAAPASGTATARPARAAGPPIVAVRARGALVVLDSATGAVTQTLVPRGVAGDEVSVAPGGAAVYFTRRHGCTSQIESVPLTGGSPVVIAAGSLPAVSPDGTKLAFAREPSLSVGCVPSQPDLTPLFRLVVRTLSSGAETTVPMVPPGQSTGLPAPISHLSWAPDSRRIAVSVSAIQDNEGWNVVIVDSAAARYYLTGPGTTSVPVTGAPDARISYLREGVFLPDGNLFASRACCGGVPVRNTSRLMWEITTSGALVRQVAVGYPALEHTSLAADRAGKWLLYLAGQDLYVSHRGHRPHKLASGLAAAAWS